MPAEPEGLEAGERVGDEFRLLADEPERAQDERVEVRAAAEQRRDAEDSAVNEQENQIRQLDAAEKELERRLAEMPAKRAALLARQSAAAAKGARVGATSKAASSVSSALEAFERMEEKVIRAEVEAEVVSADRGHIDLDTSSIDNMGVEEALNILKFIPKRSAGIVAKTVRTAVANAENTQSVDVDRLFVKLAQVDEGGMWKRFTSRAQGRATRVRKRLSHITIIVDEAEERS